MRVEVKFLTSPEIVSELGRWTSRRSGEVMTATKLQRYIDAEHSPIRGLIMLIDMLDIPAYSTSVHFARHKFGVEHFVTSNRPDKTGKDRAIDDLVNHRMLLNYQALLNIARRRLCGKASIETRRAMELIKAEVFGEAYRQYGKDIAEVLASNLVPMCDYRQGCHEFSSCGRWP